LSVAHCIIGGFHPDTVPQVAQAILLLSKHRKYSAGLPANLAKTAVLCPQKVLCHP